MRKSSFKRSTPKTRGPSHETPQTIGNIKSIGEQVKLTNVLVGNSPRDPRKFGHKNITGEIIRETEARINLKNEKNKEKQMEILRRKVESFFSFEPTQNMESQSITDKDQALEFFIKNSFQKPIKNSGESQPMIPRKFERKYAIGDVLNDIVLERIRMNDIQSRINNENKIKNIIRKEDPTVLPFIDFKELSLSLLLPRVAEVSIVPEVIVPEVVFSSNAPLPIL